MPHEPLYKAVGVFHKRVADFPQRKWREKERERTMATMPFMTKARESYCNLSAICVLELSYHMLRVI